MVTEQKAREDIRRAFEIYNTKDMGIIARWYDESLALDCVYHGPGGGPPVQGREAIKQFVRELYEAIPALYHNAPDDLIVQGDKVAVRHTVSRTNPETGKRQSCTIMFIDHYAGDRVLAEWELVGPWQDDA
jgi:predicted ester cyclase